MSKSNWTSTWPRFAGITTQGNALRGDTRLFFLNTCVPLETEEMSDIIEAWYHNKIKSYRKMFVAV